MIIIKQFLWMFIMKNERERENEIFTRHLKKISEVLSIKLLFKMNTQAECWKKEKRTLILQKFRVRRQKRGFSPC